MAWDINLRLANAADIIADGAGSWVDGLDLPAGGYTPRAGTMLIADYARMGVAEFVVLVSGATLGGDVNPTRVDLVLDIEEADDASGTNVQPVGRIRMGTGTVVATPTGYAFTKAAASTTLEQFKTALLVTKRWLRYRADVTLTGGTNPTVVFENITIYVRGVGADISEAPSTT